MNKQTILGLIFLGLLLSYSCSKDDNNAIKQGSFSYDGSTYDLVSYLSNSCIFWHNINNNMLAL